MLLQGELPPPRDQNAAHPHGAAYGSGRGLRGRCGSSGSRENENQDGDPRRDERADRANARAASPLQRHASGVMAGWRGSGVQRRVPRAKVRKASGDHFALRLDLAFLLALVFGLALG